MPPILVPTPPRAEMDRPLRSYAEQVAAGCLLFDFVGGSGTLGVMPVGVWIPRTAGSGRVGHGLGLPSAPPQRHAIPVGAATGRASTTLRSAAVPAPLPSWHGRWATEIRKLETLADGWDGDEAPAPSAVALANARQALGESARQGIKPVRIAAFADGGVVLWYLDGSGEAARIECFNGGEVIVVAPRARAHEREHGLGDDLDDRIREAESFPGGLEDAVAWLAGRLSPRAALADVPAGSSR